MSKVLVTKQHLIDIGDAIREKNGTADKIPLTDMAQNIKNIKTESAAAPDFIEQYCTSIQPTLTIKSATLRSDALNGLANLDGVNKIILENVTTLDADCGSISNQRMIDEDNPAAGYVPLTVVFKKPVTIEEDGLETSSNVTLRFEGGIKSITANSCWAIENVVFEIAGAIPAGKPWGEDTVNVEVKSIYV